MDTYQRIAYQDRNNTCLVQELGCTKIAFVYYKSCFLSTPSANEASMKEWDEWVLFDGKENVDTPSPIEGSQGILSPDRS